VVYLYFNLVQWGVALESDGKNKELEELLALVNKEVDNTVQVSQLVPTDPILSFITKFDIKPGENKVPSKILFKLFKKHFKRTEINSHTFCIRLSDYFFYKSGYFNISIDVYYIKNLYKPPKRINKSKFYNTRILKFMSHYDIKPGPLYIELDILFYLFNNFIDEYKLKQMSIQRFSQILSEHLKSKYFKDKRYKYFAVDESIKNKVDQQLVKNWREGRFIYHRPIHEKYEAKEENNILYKQKKSG
jgi:hypothetical protein